VTVTVVPVSHFSVNHFGADACATQYEMIAANNQTATSAFYKVV